jgi:hypothetical protein
MALVGIEVLFLIDDDQFAAREEELVGFAGGLAGIVGVEGEVFIGLIFGKWLICCGLFDFELGLVGGELGIDEAEAFFELGDAAEEAVDGAVELGVGFEHGEAGVDGDFDVAEFRLDVEFLGVFEEEGAVPERGFDELGAGDVGASDGDFADDVEGDGSDGLIDLEEVVEELEEVVLVLVAEDGGVGLGEVLEGGGAFAVFEAVGAGAVFTGFGFRAAGLGAVFAGDFGFLFFGHFRSFLDC